MNLRIYWALAKGVVLESIRRKDLWVVAILGFLILIASGTLGFFGVAGLEIFVKDLAVTVLGLFSTIIAVLSACRLMPEETKNRTLYPLLARPISRFDLLAGKLLGAVLVTWIGFAMLCSLTTLALLSFHVPFEVIMGQYVIAKMMGLVVICAVSLAFSTFMTPAAAATMSIILAFGGGMISRALVMSYSTASPATQWFFKFVNGILPQVNLFDLGGRAVYFNWSPVPLWVMGALFAYMAIYSWAMLGLGWLKFRRQAL